MATNNNINNATGSLTIDPGASGDSWLQYDINATNEWRMGVDDDDGDAFKISQGNALGTNDTFTMTPNGERRLPLNPAFAARLSVDEHNVTGAGATHQIGSTSGFTEIFDQGSNFNTNGTFTAPITGRYFISGYINVGGLTSSMTTGLVEIEAVSRNWQSNVINAGNMKSVNDELTFNFSSLIDMDAGDFANISITISNGASNGADIFSTYFTGWLAV